MKRVAFCLIVLSGALFYRAGVVSERLALKATCDSDDLPTVINGTTYVCLSPMQAAALRRALQQRGV